MNRRTLSLWAVSLLALSLSVPVLAQKPTTSPSSSTTTPASVVQLKMELQGEYLYRFIAKATPAIAPTPLPTGATVALPVPANVKPEDAELEIYDNTRGNLARLRVDTKAVTSVGETAFKFVQAVYVPVQSGGKPVTNVQVSLSTADKKYQSTWLLKPSDNGTARFESVPMSEPITITVSYASNPPKSVTETLPRAHAVDGHHREPLVVDWADVKTTAPANIPNSPSSAGQGGNGAPITLPSPNPTPPPSSNTFWSSFVGLLFVGGAGYGIWRAYQNGKLKEVLEKLGVNIAPNADPEPIANPFTKPQQAPIQPITEGTADPFSGGSSNIGYNGVSTAPPVLVSVPRLIGSVGTYQGVIFDLNSSSVVIGRDASNGVPLPNDTNASRRHATLTGQAGQFTITDNGSSNGTFVNGVKILTGTPHPLRTGDEIQIGMTRFRFEA